MNKHPLSHHPVWVSCGRRCVEWLATLQVMTTGDLLQNGTTHGNKTWSACVDAWNVLGKTRFPTV